MQMICICNDTAKGNFCQVPKPKENSEKNGCTAAIDSAEPAMEIPWRKQRFFSPYRPVKSVFFLDTCGEKTYNDTESCEDVI